MINLTVVVDNEEAVKKLRELQNVAKTTTSNVVDNAELMDQTFNKLKNTIISLTASMGMMQFVKQVVSVRGEFQQLEVAFNTMLGSKEKADKLMAELIDIAAKTPFGLQDVSQAAKQLLAYGSSASEVKDEIIMLGDIAAGLSIPLGDLIYLYGTTRAQGRMFTMDLRQFMGRGIPLAKELAKQFGVTEDAVSQLVTDGKVGFEDMHKALAAMTSEGGQFGGLMEKQSATVTGQISAIQDSIQVMFNEIGKSTEGIINGTLGAVSWVVEHWRELLNVLKYVVITYGTYKAAVIAVAAWHKLMAISQTAVAFVQLAMGIRKAKDAMLLFSMVTKASPIGLIAALVGAVAASFISLGDSADSASSSMDNLDDSTEGTVHAMNALEQAVANARNEINSMFDEIFNKDTPESRRFQLISQLVSMYPELANVIDIAALSTDQLTEAQKMLNEELDKEQQIKEAEGRKNAAKERLDAAKVQLNREDIRPKVEAHIQQYRDTGKLPYYDVWEGHNTETVKEALYNDSDKNVGKYINDMYSTVHATLKKELTEAYDAAASGEIDYAQFLERLHNANIRTYNAAIETASKYKMDYGTHVIQNGTMIDSGYGYGGYDIAGIKESEWYNTVVGRIDDYNKAKEEYEKAEAEYNNKLTSLGKSTTPLTDTILNESTNYIEAYNKARADLESAKADLENAILTGGEKDVIYYKGLLETAQKAYDELAKPYDEYLREQERQREEQRRRNEEWARKQERIKSAERKLEEDAAKARIDAMEDGFDKEMAEIEYEYNSRIKSIDEQEKSLRELKGELTKEQKDMFDEMRSSALTNYVNDTDVLIFGDPKEREKQLALSEKTMDEYLEEYGTFKERFEATKRRYEREISEAETEGEKLALQRERDAAIALFELEAKGFTKDLANKTVDEIDSLISQYKDKLKGLNDAYNALDSSDSEDAKNLMSQINETKAALQLLEDYSSEGKDNIENEEWEEATLVLQNITSAANDAADGIDSLDSGLAEGIRTISKFASIGVNLVGTLKEMDDAFEKSASALEKTSVVLTLISVVIQAVTALYDLFKSSGEESQFDKTLRQFKELNNELERMHEKSRLNSFEDTIFGDSAYGNFVNNIEVMNDALTKLGDTQDKIAKRGREFVAGGGIGAWDKDVVIGGWQSTGKSGLAIDRNYSWDSYYDSLANMQVQMQHSTWFRNAKYKSLADVAPEIFSGGELSLEALKKLQENELYQKLSQENRDLIDELIANWELYEEALESVKDYLSDVFGDVGNAITKSLTDSFRNGTDAAKDMAEEVSSIMEKMVTDLAYYALITPMLAQAQAAVDDLNKRKGELTDEEYMRGLLDISINLMSQMKAQQDAWNNTLSNAKEWGAENGLDIFKSDSEQQSASSKGFQAMSQETGDELNGRFTDIQGQTRRIAHAVDFCNSLQIEQNAKITSINSTVAMIHNDTSLIASHTKALNEMREDLSSIRRSIDNGII